MDPIEPTPEPTDPSASPGHAPSTEPIPTSPGEAAPEWLPDVAANADRPPAEPPVASGSPASTEFAADTANAVVPDAAPPALHPERGPQAEAQPGEGPQAEAQPAGPAPAPVPEPDEAGPVDAVPADQGPAEALADEAGPGTEHPSDAAGHAAGGGAATPLQAGLGISTVEPADPAAAAAAPAAAAPEHEMTASGLHSGQIVEGRVTAVGPDEVVLELHDGSIAVIGKRHLSATGQVDPASLLDVGDAVEAAVLVRDDPQGRTVLSRAWALKQRAWEQVEAAKRSRTPITGLVTGQVKGGLVVDVGTRAFLPASQVDLHHVDDLSSFVGQQIEALVHEVDRVTDKIVLSRRNLLRNDQRSKANEFAATLAAGQVHRGRVSMLTDFGAFVEIGGVRGLVHLSELAWRRVEHAAEVVTPGTDVDVKVLAVKPGKKLSLSIRALTPDPLTTLQTGQILTGVVTRLADFGAFVRVGDGAEGLVHVTELAEYRVHAPEEVVTPGDEVLVKVLRIDRKRRRLDLSVNQAVLS